MCVWKLSKSKHKLPFIFHLFYLVRLFYFSLYSFLDFSTISHKNLRENRNQQLFYVQHLFITSQIFIDLPVSAKWRLSIEKGEMNMKKQNKTKKQSKQAKNTPAPIVEKLYEHKYNIKGPKLVYWLLRWWMKP